MVWFHTVSKHYGTQEVLSQTSCQINPGEKIGLIGPNGAGKTTFIRLLLGMEEPSDGSVTRDPAMRAGYVPQYLEFDDTQLCREYLMAEFVPLERRLREEEEKLAAISEEEMEKALSRYQRARDAFDAVGGDDVPVRAERILEGLGLGRVLDQPVGTLSGGEKNVLALARALLFQPDLLVLDEPGNHLDYIGLAWLERFLTDFGGTVLVVSHNRYLLDRVVDRIFELEDRRISEYVGNYSHYRMTKLRNLVAQQAEYTANQKRLAQLEELVARFEQIARAHPDPKWGKRLRARRTQLRKEQEQAVERPELASSQITLDIDSRKTKADIALQINGYTKGFGERLLFDNASLEMRCGERLALVGPNGCGKSTLLRDVMDYASWDSDVLRIGPSLTVGYCSQNQDVFDPEQTILDAFRDLGPSTRHAVHGVLGRFLFTWEDLDKRIATLSGGEKNRLQLARLEFLQANFLILDEPTNHMDIAAREAIEESLLGFSGTILIVSHDRYLLDKIATSIVEVREQKLLRFPGNFSEFWAERKVDARGVHGRVGTRAKEYGKERAAEPAGARRPASRETDETERRILELETEKEKLEQQITAAFSNGDHQQGRRLSGNLERVARRIEKLYAEWE